MMQGLGRDNALKLTDYNSIENKVLIMIGDKDQMVTLEETIDVYRNLKDSNLMVLPNTIHPIEKVNLNKLSSELIDFIK
jgi:esterase/lipase